jgi:predicted O-linked N-acetylglucosamine transferase (SPINDLY family)
VRALEAAPDFAPALYNLGMVRHETGRLEEAEACFRRLLALQPRDAEALFHLGALLQKRLRLDEAADVFRRALEVAPQDYHLWMRLGAVLVAKFTDKSLGEAEACFRKAAGLRPEEAVAHAALAHACKLQERHAEALASLAQAQRLDQAAANLQADLLHEMQSQCDWSRLAELSGLVLRGALEPAEHPVPPFCLLSIASTPRQQLACARLYAQSVAGPLEAERRRLAFQSRPAAKPRLRIGYLSPEFHAHATAYLAAELFELHDRARFEAVAYSYGPEDGSVIRARLKRAIPRFVDITSLPDAEAAAAIHADGVDILVDLKGYTFRARTAILTLRPAPLQVNYLGYPGTMGAGFVDYLIGDRIVTPAARAGDYDEKLVILPDCYQPNDRLRRVARTPPRAALGLPDIGFVFCCFNQSFKILPEVFAAWMRLLAAVPGSVLWLLSSPAAENLRREAAARGVDPARLVFAKQMPLGEHLGRMAAADLFLDTFPYNAHTTASDALWTGLPLVTCAGETFASRVAASLLTAMGFPELVTGSLADYEALALRLAQAPAELLMLRDRLQRTRARAALFDTPRYVRNLEAAYEAMWAAHSAGQPPRQIEL